MMSPRNISRAFAGVDASEGIQCFEPGRRTYDDGCGLRYLAHFFVFLHYLLYPGLLELVTRVLSYRA